MASEAFCHGPGDAVSTVTRSVGYRSAPTGVEGGVEDLEPSVEQGRIEGVGGMEPPMSFDHLVGRFVRLAEEHSHPEFGQLSGVSVPIDMGESVEVVVESVVLSDLTVEASDELGDFFSGVEVAVSVLRWSGATHRRRSHVGGQVSVGFELGGAAIEGMVVGTAAASCSLSIIHVSLRHCRG